MRGQQQQLPAVGVAVDGLILGDADPAGEIVVQVSRPPGRHPLQHGLEVVEQQRLVLIDRDPERRVERLQMDASVDEAGGRDLVLNLLG